MTVSRNCFATLFTLLLACAITLTLRGYQVGHSNHTVYLLDALRHNDPRLLSTDWFTTHTLQYHVVFTTLTAALDRLHLLRPAFLTGYLLLVALLHLAWLRLTLALGGNHRIYLLSVVLFFISAAGFGLGAYDFLQDSAFLPSNVANVAMLWGIHFLVVPRVGSASADPARAGILLGIAGLFHVNYALIAIALWFTLILWDSLRLDAKRIIGSVILLALCTPSILPTARAALHATHKMPLHEFVDLYVRLRHPHHYDPSSWPLALWISFLWPFPLAILAARRAPASIPLRKITRIFLFFCALQLISLLFAGVWYVSEPLIQLSLFRFSIFPKLFTCMGAAAFLYRNPIRPVLAYVSLAIVAVALIARLIFNNNVPPIVEDNFSTLLLLILLLLCCATFELVEGLPRRRRALAVLAIPVLAIGAAFVHSRINHYRLLGLQLLEGINMPPSYLDLCHFARDHTPVDAIFLVPPNEQEFRLVARRGIIVNFKGVPQLSSELGEWRDRLCRVLDMPSLAPLPHRFDRALAAISIRYDEVPAEHLVAVAEHYGARYLLATHPLDLPAPARLVFERGRYHLYDLRP
jgi:hypothetical protein